MPISRIPSETSDFSYNVSSGEEVGKSIVNKFGGGCDAVTDTVTDVWDYGDTVPVYPWPTTATITYISQKVDQAAMRGATIEVQGLDANWDLSTQTIDLDGSDTTTPVVLVPPLIRVFRKKVLANVVGDQDITAHNTANSVDYSVIQAGNNQTLMALYTVPAGKTAYMLQYYSSVTSTTNKDPIGTEIRLWAADRGNSYAFQLKHATSIPEKGSNEHHHFNVYMSFSEKTDIKMTMQPLDDPGHIHAGFDLILEDN